MNRKEFKQFTQSIGKMLNHFAFAYQNKLAESLDEYERDNIQISIKRDDNLYFDADDNITEAGKEALKRTINRYRLIVKERMEQLENDGIDKHRLEAAFLKNVSYNLDRMEAGKYTVGTENQTEANQILNGLPSILKEIEGEDDLEEMEKLQESVPLDKAVEAAYESQRAADQLREAGQENPEALESLKQASRAADENALNIFVELEQKSDTKEMKSLFDAKDELTKEDGFLKKTLSPTIKKMRTKLHPEREAAAESTQGKREPSPQEMQDRYHYSEAEISERIEKLKKEKSSAEDLGRMVENDRRMVGMTLQAIPDGPRTAWNDIKLRQESFQKRLNELEKFRKDYKEDSQAFTRMENALKGVLELNEKSTPDEIRNAYKELDKAAEGYQNEHGGMKRIFHRSAGKKCLGIADELRSMVKNASLSYNMARHLDHQMEEPYKNYYQAMQDFSGLKIMTDKEPTSKVHDLGMNYLKLAQAGDKLSPHLSMLPGMTSMVNTFNADKYKHVFERTAKLGDNVRIGELPGQYDTSISQWSEVLAKQKEANKAYEQNIRNQYASLGDEGLRRDFFTAAWTAEADKSLTIDQQKAYAKLFQEYMNPMKEDGKTPDQELAQSRRKGIEELQNNYSKDQVSLKADFMEEAGLESKAEPAKEGTAQQKEDTAAQKEGTAQQKDNRIFTSQKANKAIAGIISRNLQEVDKAAEAREAAAEAEKEAQQKNAVKENKNTRNHDRRTTKDNTKNKNNTNML